MLAHRPQRPELSRANRDEYFTTALAPAFAAYVFGRFLLGYWVARKGWLTDPAALAALLARALPRLLGFGFALSLSGFGAQWLLDESSPLLLPAEVAIEASKLLLAAGYALLVLRLFQTARGRALTAALAAVGRMALSNYLAHSLVYLFVLYGFGLALLPLAGPTFCLLLALAVFALQVALSSWWLARFSYGPAEYLWRWATYGQRPRKPLQGQSTQS